jgi:hypothetical protein
VGNAGGMFSIRLYYMTFFLMLTYKGDEELGLVRLEPGEGENVTGQEGAVGTFGQG